MKKPTTDRRAHQRFDVLGSLWGVLELPETASIVNASGSGILIEASVCPVLDSVHETDLFIAHNVLKVETAVRHLHPSAPGKFLIGLEFLNPAAPVVQAMEHLTAAEPTKVPDPEASHGQNA